MVRKKSRFLVVEISAERSAKKGEQRQLEIFGALRESLQDNFGDFGLGSALPSLQVRFYDPLSGICVVRASRDTHRMVWAALTFLTKSKQVAMRANVCAVAGSARTCSRTAARIYARRYAELGLPEREAARLLQEREKELATLDV